MPISSDSSRRGNSSGAEWTIITPAATTLNPKPRALHCNVAGNATLVDSAGNSQEFAFLAGLSYPYSPAKVTAATATLIGIY